MNDIASALLWGIGQITVVSLAAACLYVVAAHSGPRNRAVIAMCGLLITAALSILTLSPWPRWGNPAPLSSDEAPSTDIASSTPAVSSASADEPSPTPRATKRNDSSPPNDFSLAAARTFVAASLQPPANIEKREQSLPSRATQWGLVTAITLVLLGIARFAAGWWSIRGLCRRAASVEDPVTVTQLNALRTRLACQQPVQLRESPEVKTAAALGWRHPAIVLPVEWRRWTGAELSAVLAHELAHIRRGDALMNLIAQAALVVQFYHPLAHWLLAKLRLEQELAADADAATVSGGRDHYLKCLAGLALQRESTRLAWPARAFLPTRHTFMKRIEMLRRTDSLRERFPQLTRRGAIAALVLCGLVVSGFRPVPAGGPGKPESPQATAKQPPRSDDSADDSAQAERPNVLAYVPSDAKFVGKLEVAKLLGDPKFAPLTKLLLGENGPNDQLKKTLGLELDQIEQVATFVLKVDPKSSPRPYFVIRSSEPWPDTPENSPAKVILRDGRTLVVAGASAGRGDGANRALTADDLNSNDSITQQPLIRRFADSDLMLFGDVASVREVLRQQGQRTGMLVATVKPLLEDINRIALSMTLDSDAKQLMVAETRDAEAAQRVKQTTEALLTLADNALNELATTLAKNTTSELPRGPNDAPSESELASSAIDIGRKLLDSAKVGVDDSQVTVSFDADDALFAAGVAVLAPAVRNARAAAQRVQGMNNLKQIGVALHNYHADHGSLPPAVIVENGIQRSWRVELLPYLNQQALYDRYQKDEPWDSEANQKVRQEMPAVFAHAADNRPGKFASYFAVLGEEDNAAAASAWKPQAAPPGTPGDDPSGGETGGVRFTQISDGTSNTLCVVTASRQIPWTKPEDIRVDLSSPVDPGQFGGFSDRGFAALFCDGHIQFVSDSIDQTVLQGFLTRAGGEPIDFR